MDIKKLTMSALLACSLGGTAMAATSTGTLNVEATVVNACSVDTTAVNFGTVDTAVKQATGSVTVTCTNTGGFDVELDSGANSASTSSRTLKIDDGGTESFTYQLYTESSHSTVWGEGTDKLVYAGGSALNTFTVYGQTTSTPQKPGTYTDAVVVTVTF